MCINHVSGLVTAGFCYFAIAGINTKSEDCAIYQKIFCRFEPRQICHVLSSQLVFENEYSLKEKSWAVYEVFCPKSKFANFDEFFLNIVFILLFSVFNTKILNKINTFLINKFLPECDVPWFI